MTEIVWPIKHGIIKNDETNMYPSALIGHTGQGKTHFESISSTFFGVVIDGEVALSHPEAGSFPLRKGMYFSSPGQTAIEGNGRVAIFERKGYRGLFHIGGPVESAGRLVYIDSCRATLLISPPRLGDACLNLLTFPTNIRQTMHIHPTIRMGTVLSGHGLCILGSGQELPLSPGDVFYLGEATRHCFHSKSEPLTIIAYHPDSDFGPTDESHPMLNRTFTKI